MSRPRAPFGRDQPGRLPATVVKVLAAEMSDPGRLTRGKRYWSEHAVLDIVIGHGAVTAEVQGSRPLPYVVTIEARPGLGAPARRDLTVRCTCPDDDGTGQWACKHAVAALFALSDEIAIEPDVMARWRRSDSVTSADTEPEDPTDHLTDGTDSGAPADELAARRDRRRVPSSADDELAPLLTPPAGRALPPMPVPPDVTHPRPGERLVADVLDDALEHLRIRWE